MKLYGVAPENVTVFETTWSEHVSEWLLQYKGILFFIGLIALYLEFKAPGFGVAGIVGIVAFALFFFAGTIGGVADSIEIVLFVAGLILIALELFVIPGFGLPGIAGIVLVVASLYLASTPFAIPTTPIARDFLFRWMLHFGGALVGTAIFAVLAARFLPDIPLFNRLMLSPPDAAAGLDASGTRIRPETHPLVGTRGRALSRLRPAGRAEVDGRKLDVVTEGSFVEVGDEIEVVKVKGNRIVVRPAHDARKPGDETERTPRRDFNY
jgi:membrane-bound serine protease (ClpP class)